MAWFTYNIKLLYLSIFGYLETMAIPLYYVWKKNFEKTFNFATFFSYFSLISIKKYCPKLDFLLPEKWNQFFRILGYFLEQFQRFSWGLQPLENLWNCSQIYPKIFSTDFIFRQQENLVDNQKCQAGFRPLCNKIPRFTWKSNGGSNSASP